MTPSQGRLFKTIIANMICALLMQSAVFAQQPDPARTERQAEATESASQLPDSPGTVQARPTQATSSTATTTPEAQAVGVVAPRETAQASTPMQQTTSPQQPIPHEPVGTAAAESIPVSGIAASRPAGAAVAPAKQRRVRSILIKVGAVVGIGVAVGTTVALSQGSPSKPPGSR